MLRNNEIRQPLTADAASLRRACAKALRCGEDQIKSVEIATKAVDSRKKEDVHFVYNVFVTLNGEEAAVLAHCRNPKVSVEQPYVYEAPPVRGPVLCVRSLLVSARRAFLPR